MTAPHHHTTAEVITAIKKIGHNDRTGTDGATEGAPTGIKGGSIGNKTVTTPNVTSSEKGSDWVGKRGIKDAG